MASLASDVGLAMRPLSPVMGAEIAGIDLSQPLDDAVFAAIRTAFHRHMLLSFPDQSLSQAAQVAFSRRFGALQVHVLDQYRSPAHPEIYVLSNVNAAGETTGTHPDKGTLVWHSDLSFQRRPALATILHGLEVPRAGGDTMFADMAAAYDALPEATKARIGGLRALHDLDWSRRRAGEPPMTEAQRKAAPPVDHPLVRTHPESGRKCLYFSHHAMRVLGLPETESTALLEALMAHATQPRFVYAHRWRKGEVVMWDNRCTMHRATGYDPKGERRVIHRTVVLGDVPV